MMTRTQIFIAAQFFTVVCVAQNRVFSAGIEAGPSVNQLNGFERMEGVDQNRKISVTGGVFFLFTISKHLSLKTGITHEKKGLHLTSSDQSNYPNVIFYRTTINLEYTVVPVLLRAAWGKKVKRFFTVGGYGAYLNRKSELALASNTDIPTTKYDYTNKTYRPYDWGLVSGMGITFTVAERFLFTYELRHNLGVADISSQNKRIRTNSVTFLAGIAYNFYKSIRSRYDLKAPKTGS